MVTIKIILGSTRPGRFGIQPATWITGLVTSRKDTAAELLDLQVVNLPFLDEQNSPAERKYEKEHTKKWSQKIGEADGFVFVTPEYNYSMPATLKNAVDFLFHEWNYKPVCFVSYGAISGGMRAVEQLKLLASTLKMYPLRETVAIQNYWAGMDHQGKYVFTDDMNRRASIMLDELVFWAKKMKEGRDELLSISKS